MNDSKAKIQYRLPSLGAFSHVLRNSRGYAYDYSTAKDLYDSILNQPNHETQSRELLKTMNIALGEASKRWPGELKRRDENWRNGLPFLESLKHELARLGLTELSQRISHTAYIPARISPSDNQEIPAKLFIRVPEGYLEQISNRNGFPRRNFQEAAGCRLYFEKMERKE